MVDSRDIAIESLACGNSVKQSAELANVSIRTVFNWLQDPEFKTALDNRKGEVLQAISHKLIIAVNKSLDVLNNALDSKNVTFRLRAAGILLARFSGTLAVADFEERISRLENK